MPIGAGLFKLKTMKSFKSFWAYFLSSFLATYLCFIPFASIGIDPHHDGLMLKTALDLFDGQEIFRETFTQYGILTSYIQSLFIRVFGEELHSLRIGTVLLYSLASAVFISTWRRILPPFYVGLCLVLWITIAPFFRPGWYMLPWSSSYALFFQALVALAMVESFGESRPGGMYAFFAGVFAGFTVLCRIPVGVLTAFGGILVYLYFGLAHRFCEGSTKRLASFVGGLSSVIFGVAFALVNRGATQDWYIQTIRNPRSWMDLVTNQEPLILSASKCLLSFYDSGWIFLALACLYLVFRVLNLLSGKTGWFFHLLLIFIGFIVFKKWPLSFDIFGGLGFFIPIVLVFGFFILYLRYPAASKKTPAEFYPVLAITVIGVASWPQYFPVRCYRHVFWSVAPMIGAFVYFWCRLFEKNGVWGRLLLALLIVPLIGNRVSLSKITLTEEMVELAEPKVLQGMKVQKEFVKNDLPGLLALERVVKLNPKSPIFLEGADALPATLAVNRRNPGPYFIDWPSSHPPYVEKRMGFVKASRPIIVLNNRPKSGLYSGDVYIQEDGYTEVFKDDHYRILLSSDHRRY